MPWPAFVKQGGEPVQQAPAVAQICNQGTPHSAPTFRQRADGPASQINGSPGKLERLALASAATREYDGGQFWVAVSSFTSTPHDHGGSRRSATGYLSGKVPADGAAGSGGHGHRL